MSIKIYVEGGGNGHKLKIECRQGFSKFFEKAGLAGRMPAIVACGSRNDAYDSFCTALKRPKENQLPLLLVDSEAPVTKTPDEPWAHLLARDKWQKPNGATDDDVYLMMECMESWFLADPGCLKDYFGQGFREKSLPKTTKVETISKKQVFDSLKMATRNAQPKGEYGKGKHSFGILGSIDPNKVRSVAPGVEKLLKKLKKA